jgi:hypothetical protein
VAAPVLPSWRFLGTRLTSTSAQISTRPKTAKGAEIASQPSDPVKSMSVSSIVAPRLMRKSSRPSAREWIAV